MTEHAPDPEEDPFLQEPSPPPACLYAAIDSAMSGVWTVAAMHAASQTGLLEVFRTPTTPAEAALSTGSDEGVMKALVAALCEVGLLARVQGGRFEATPCGLAYVLRSSVYSQDAYIAHCADTMVRLAGHLPEILKHGPIEYTPSNFFAEISLAPMGENAMTGRLQRTIRAIRNLPRFTQARKALDLGGGHGLYAVALTRANPDLIVSVMDLPDVIAFAKEYTGHYDNRRIHFISGSFFTTPLGEGYDIVLSSSNPSGKSLAMVPRIAAAMNGGGYFINIQPEGNRSPDPFRDLEKAVWRFRGEARQTMLRSRDTPLVTPEYLAALAASGLRVISTGSIGDDYHAGELVTVLIAEKEYS